MPKGKESRKKRSGTMQSQHREVMRLSKICSAKVNSSSSNHLDHLKKKGQLAYAGLDLKELKDKPRILNNQITFE